MSLLAQLLQLYAIVIFVRIIFSWFPISRGSPMESVHTALYRVTEPVLGPVRRAVPPLGGFDFSAVIVMIGCQLLARSIA